LSLRPVIHYVYTIKINFMPRNSRTLQLVVNGSSEATQGLGQGRRAVNVQVSHLIDQTMEEPDILNARSMRKTTPFNGDKYARSRSSFHKTNRDDTLNPEIFIKSKEVKPHIQAG